MLVSTSGNHTGMWLQLHTTYAAIVAVLFSERSQRILYALQCILNKDKNNISFIYTYASNTI